MSYVPDDAGVWVAYWWDSGYHIHGIYPSAEAAVRAHGLDDSVMFVRFGESLKAAEDRAREAD